MRSIINNLEIMFIRNALNSVDITKISIHVHRNNSACFLIDQIFNLVGVHRIIIRFNIREDRSKSLANNCMRGGCKAVWRGNDLAFKLHCLKYALKSLMTVDEKSQIIDA